MRILAVGAHPDDLEILCAGTLVRYAREGHDVVMCNVAVGDKGSTVHTSEQIAAIRLGEAQRAAAIAGAEHQTLGLRDTEIAASDAAQRLLMVELLREVRPYMDTLAGIAFNPQEYVDITTSLDAKLEMLAAHESQIAFLGNDEEPSIVDDVRTIARFRGIQAGVGFAEGFVQAQAWHRGTTRRLLPA